MYPYNTQSSFALGMPSGVSLLIRIFVPLFTLLAVSVIAGATPHKDGVIIERVSYVFPTYDQAKKNTDVEDYASKQEY